MRRMWWFVLFIICFFAVGSFALFRSNLELAYLPSQKEVLNPPSTRKTDYYDLWGETIVPHKSKQKLSPSKGAIHVTPEMLKLGKKTFYQETFGNEVFLSDILGLMDGPFTFPQVMKAIIQLRGQGTSNLKVPLAKTVTIGGKTFRKGTKIDTGIDVPKGSYLPIGLPVKFSEGKLKVGVSCAACHAKVDTRSKKIVEGAINNDLNYGLLLALAPNSSSYFTHSQLTPEQLHSLTSHLKKLPDPKKMEQAVDRTLVRWPKGTFDSTNDLVSNPTKVPDAFTLHAHPYGWSGFASVGPFKGLSSFSNNVHAQNSDPLSQTALSQPLFGMSQDLYLGIILQNAANPKYRYHPEKGDTPTQFFSKIDPTPKVVGVNENIQSPSFPKSTPIAPNGVMVNSKGYRAGEQIYALSAWNNTIIPPKAPISWNRHEVNLGKKVFARANCISCHAGKALTKNRVVPVEQIKTEPSRAAALKKTQNSFGKPLMYPPDTPVPIPKGTKPLSVPVPDPEQVKLGFAHQSKGGYKIPSLIGLYWRAPYLHDAGVAVGPKKEWGVTGTLLNNVQPDPVKSLRALIDREWRKKVIEANRKSLQLKDLHIQGVGHSFWVDSAAGFSRKEQDALIKYLLSN